MCWSMEASAGLVMAGAVATTATYRRGESAAIWGTMAYFTAMETLQVAGYLVIDDCGTPSNRNPGNGAIWSSPTRTTAWWPWCGPPDTRPVPKSRPVGGA